MNSYPIWTFACDKGGARTRMHSNTQPNTKMDQSVSLPINRRIIRHRLRRFSWTSLRVSPIALIALIGCLSCSITRGSVSGPEIMVYKTVADTKLTAHVFHPEGAGTDIVRPAIVIFHGGGWAAGSPEWVYDVAKRYAALGAITVAAEYRLSDKDTLITPIEALEDARDIVRWMRNNSSRLGLDPYHIAAYGVSAGGHLAASLVFFGAAEKNQTSALPDALVLISPAVAMGKDKYFQSLLGKRSLGRDYSPDDQMDQAPPPSIVFNGSIDNLTPLVGVAHYCELAKQHGGECQLIVYQGVGHLFTRKQPFDSRNFDPDPKAWDDATNKADAFLAEKGFLPQWLAKSNSSEK
jgi:acetyl esterase